MTTSFQHPSDFLLKAYAQGRLPLEQASSLDSHLENCEECGRKLAEVGSDTFCDLLQQQTEALPASPSVNPDLPAALQNHTRYDIQERLGRGGMGVVYRAVHRMMHRPVALKLIRPELLASPQAVERFRREVRAAAKLAHPNIVAAYDAEEIGGVHFLVMEYVDGKTLDAIVKKRGPLPVPVACHLARQVALGLEHAHSHGMVHRDIKPLNLILAEKSKVKILDFGLALWQSGEALEPATKEGQALGTLLFAAPEQRTSAGSVDARADQYSLGATLAYLLTGDPPPRNQQWPESIPRGLQEILSRLLAKAPEDRYESAKEVAEALTPWCSSKSPSLDTSKRWRNFRIAMGAVAAGIAIALAISVVSLARDRVPKTHPAKVVAAPPPPVKHWKSLLNFDPKRYAVSGDWQMSLGELHVIRRRPPSDMESRHDRSFRIEIPGAVPVEYDLRVVFTRKLGKHSVGVIVVQNGHPVVFEVDCWEQHLGGFQNIGGKTMIENPTRHDNILLVNNRRYTLFVEVRRDSIRGLLDGRVIASYRTDGRDLSLDERFWAMPNPKSLGLVAYESSVTFHSVEISAK